MIRNALDGARQMWNALASTQLASLRARLQVGGVLGPAALAYLDAEAFTPVDDRVERLPAGHPAIGALLEAAGSEDADESGIAGITSPAFVLRDGDSVVAAAGYTVWPGAVAHLCVLTDPGHRTRSLARKVASAASAHALENDLLPQWRARVEPSRRVAAALGYREFGLQLSVRLG